MRFPPTSSPRARLRRVVSLSGAALVLFGGASCARDDVVAPSATTAPDGRFPDGTTVRLVTHDSFNVSDDVLAGFTADTGIEVEIVRGGDAVTVVNQAVLAAGRPQGDVLFGIDGNLLDAALEADVFLPYEAEGLDQIDPALVSDSQHRVTPVDVGDVCVNVDDEWFDEAAVAKPTSIDDLIDPTYADLLVVQDPASSTPGLAFLLATIDRFGDEGPDGGWEAWWSALDDNGVQVVAGWEEAYNGAFTAGGGGDRPLVVSYATSPPAAVVYSDAFQADGTMPDVAPTSIIADSCYRLVESAGILRGAEDEAAARALVDFLVSERFQADVPLSMFVEPVREGTPRPEVFERFAGVVEEPAELAPAVVAESRQSWVETWTNLVAR